MRSEEVDNELQHLTLQKIRGEIDRLYNLRRDFQLTKMKIMSADQRKKLDRIGGQNEQLIRKLSQASRVRTIQQMLKKDHLYIDLYIDLHGFRGEEVYEMLEAVVRMLNDQAQQGNEKLRLRTIRGQRTACLIVMTGKGIHSRGNRSVLKQVVDQWCRQNRVEAVEEIDRMKVYIPVK